MKTVDTTRERAEKILKNAGIDFRFVAESGANGKSIYFRTKNNLKIRFSDHSVTNKFRMEDEIHFNFKQDDESFSVQQSILELQSKVGFDGIEWGKIDYTRPNGQKMKVFGYRKI